jgi:hypothetical protein
MRAVVPKPAKHGLYALRSGDHIKLRRLDGWQEIPSAMTAPGKAASGATRSTAAQLCWMIPSDIFDHLTDTALRGEAGTSRRAQDKLQPRTGLRRALTKSVLRHRGH